jgi:DDE family transposase
MCRGDESVEHGAAGLVGPAAAPLPAGARRVSPRAARLHRDRGLPRGTGAPVQEREGWGYGLKLHVQCDDAGRLCGFALTTATVDDRKLLAPLTRWMKDGIVVSDGGYLSRAKAKALAQRGGYLFTATRKNMRHAANQLQLALLRKEGLNYIILP